MDTLSLKNHHNRRNLIIQKDLRQIIMPKQTKIKDNKKRKKRKEKEKEKQ